MYLDNFKRKCFVFYRRDRIWRNYIYLCNLSIKLFIWIV